MNCQIIRGNNIDVLKTFPDNHFDSIVTDPPYGIDFLGKAWDATTGALETYQECLRVLKPGGHILAFSAPRTYHHLAVTLEQAGFEIRDQIMWIYSSGFPKSQDIGKSIERSLNKKDPNYGSKKTTQDPGITDSFGVGSRCNKCNRTFNPDIIKNCKEEPCGMQYQYQTDQGKTWAGWGTQLKPAHEPIVLARKPIRLSIAGNCQKYGVGALNIDATRVATSEPAKPTTMSKTTHANLNAEKNAEQGFDTADLEPWQPNEQGRFPSNVIGEIADYQKYFYCPKVSRRERHVGFDDSVTETNAELCASIGVEYIPNSTTLPGVGLVKDHGLKHEIQKIRGYAAGGNNHPTVKPIELMKYLIKLITPAGGRVLDPFNGSGSTGCAAVELDYDYTGIELDPKYVDIANKRIEAWYRATHNTVFAELFEVND